MVGDEGLGVPFEEIYIPLYHPESTQKISEYSLSGRVPVLLADDLVVWDPLAICEFLAERFPSQNLRPESQAARATARSICAGNAFWFKSIEKRHADEYSRIFPGKGRTAGAQADIGRVSEIWEDCLSTHGAHRFLLAIFDCRCLLAPVVMRFKTYGVLSRLPCKLTANVSNTIQL